MVSVRGSGRDLVRKPDGSVAPFQGDPNTGDALVLDDTAVGLLRGVLDALERIQQQLAKMNEDENLIPGDRHYE